jgi:translation initiation factor 5B
VGLTQQFMGERLKTTLGQPKGIVLEVKDEPGLGETANVILVDGVLRVGSIVVVGKKDGAQGVKIRALLEPKPLDEMRDPRDRFTPVQEVYAAAGVKLSAPDLEGVLAGSPVVGVTAEEGLEAAKAFVDSAVREALVQTDVLGVVLKADTLGALEAITTVLKKKDVPVRIADIGHVNKRDLVQAESVLVSDRYLGVILAFNVKVIEDAQEEATERGVRIFASDVIYTLIDDYTTWVSTEKENEQRAALSTMTPPCKFKLVKGSVFHRSGPAVFGVEVIEGTLRGKVKAMNSSGEEVGVIQQLQSEGTEVETAKKGEQVAISMKEPVIGRQIKEEEVLYTLPSSDDARLFKTRFAERLSPQELKLLDNIISMRRKVQYMYAF